MYEHNEYRAKGRSEALSALGGIRDGAPVRVEVVKVVLLIA